MLLVMSIPSIGCKNNPTVETEKQWVIGETTYRNKNNNVSTENNTVSIGEVKSVRYSDIRILLY